jgi:hypothetical protein
MYKYLFYVVIVFSSYIFSNYSHATVCFSYSTELSDGTFQEPVRRQITPQETQDVYDVLNYAFTVPVEDRSLEPKTVQLQKDLMPSFEHLMLEEKADDTLAFPDEIMLKIIGYSDMETLASLTQTSAHVAAMVFNSHLDIFKRHFNGTFNDDDKVHLKLMLGAAKLPVYVFCTYRSLSEYLLLNTQMKIDLRLAIASKVLPDEYLEKMRLFWERQNEYQHYSFWSAYNDAARLRLLNLSLLKAGQYKYIREIRRSAFSLANLSQSIAVKLGAPYDAADSYIVMDEVQSSELIEKAIHKRDLIKDKAGGLIWEKEWFPPAKGVRDFYKISLIEQ